MMHAIDETHDPKRRSWVGSAQGNAEFPIQNLPLGVFSPKGAAPRGGIAIGDEILDLKAAVEAGLFSGEAEKAAIAAAGTTLNPLMALGSAPRAALRKRVSALLAADGADRAKVEGLAAKILHHAAECAMHLPAAIGDYTDFFAGIQHAYNAGVRGGRQPPLLPNYKYVPVAYHSRASSVVVSGAQIRRPKGQRVLPGETVPSFGPCRMLDIELELGIWIGPGNPLGEPVAIGEAGEHVVGLCMLNDWSARDIQRWEMQPLGPFLAKNFGTTVSPWVITTEALAPFRQAQPPRPDGDPRPLPYLWHEADQQHGAYDVEIEALILTAAMRAGRMPPHRLALSNLNHLYWTIAQMVAHHTCSGCNLQAGDLFGSGTISAPGRSGYGSLAELSEDGKQKIALPSGETRTFLEDGDEVILRAIARRDGYVSIGFGECRGRIV
ncbi:MAG TPA: fumarylacetoacetase [Burkholderiales bacterium]|nr:fumarylacetoacetase [Burkholderiales bacterium]